MIADPFCTVFDGAHTQFLAIEPASGAPQSIGSLGGRFVSYRPTTGGWLTG